MSLALVYQEAFKMIVRMQSGKLTGKTAPQLQGVFLDLFGSLEDDAKHGKIQYSLAQLEDAEFALAAFADETALFSGDPVVSDHWTDGPKGSLTQQLFNQPNAGNEFYHRLEHTAAVNTREAGEALEVYCLCLLLGYSGARKGKELQTLTRDTLQQVERLLGRPSNLSVGDSHLSSGPQPSYDAWSHTLQRSALGLAIVAALAYLAFSIDLGVQRGRLDQMTAAAGFSQK